MSLNSIVFSSRRKTANLTVHSQYGIFPQADENECVFSLVEVFTFWVVFFLVINLSRVLRTMLMRRNNNNCPLPELIWKFISH